MIQCPYYNSNTQKQIVCKANDCVSLSYICLYQRDMALQMNIFCKARYTYCELYNLLKNGFGKESACHHDNSRICKRKSRDPASYI